MDAKKRQSKIKKPGATPANDSTTGRIELMNLTPSQRYIMTSHATFEKSSSNGMRTALWIGLTSKS